MIGHYSDDRSRAIFSVKRPVNLVDDTPAVHLAELTEPGPGPDGLA